MGVCPIEECLGHKDDTPESVRSQLAALHRDWLRQSGVAVADGVAVEISPLFALDAEELSGKLPPGEQIRKAAYFG